MKQQLITPPAYYPLNLEQVKDHLHIDFDDNDRHIQSLIATATNKVEQYLHRRLITQTWKIWLDEWPKENYIELPFGNLASVAQVYYTDTDYTQNNRACICCPCYGLNCVCPIPASKFYFYRVFRT